MDAWVAVFVVVTGVPSISMVGVVVVHGVMVEK